MNSQHKFNNTTFRKIFKTKSHSHKSQSSNKGLSCLATEKYSGEEQRPTAQRKDSKIENKKGKKSIYGSAQC